MNCASGKNEKRPSNKKGKRPSKKKKGSSKQLSDGTESLDSENRDLAREPKEETKTFEMDSRSGERKKDNKEKYDFSSKISPSVVDEVFKPKQINVIDHDISKHNEAADKETNDTAAPKKIVTAVVGEKMPKKTWDNESEQVETNTGDERDTITVINSANMETATNVGNVLVFEEIGESTDYVEGEQVDLETTGDKVLKDIGQSKCVVDGVEVHKKLDSDSETDSDGVKTAEERDINRQSHEAIIVELAKIVGGSKINKVEDIKGSGSEEENSDDDIIFIKMKSEHADNIDTELVVEKLDSTHSIKNSSNNSSDIDNHMSDTIKATVIPGVYAEKKDKSTNESAKTLKQTSDKKAPDSKDIESDTDDEDPDNHSKKEENENTALEINIDIDSTDDHPFSKYVDRSAIANVLKVHSEHIEEGHDVEVGEEIIVQYLKKADRKRLKMVLRPAAWSLNHKIRRVLWYKMCHYLHRADDSDIYAEYVEELFPKGCQEDIRIPAFVDPNHVYSFHLNRSGIRTARKILCVIEHMCPDIINSPLLYSISCLFLHYMDASQCYSCVYSMLRERDSKYLPTTKVSYDASKLVIRDLAKKYAKAGYSYLVRNVGSIDQVFDSWVWWIFEDLPITYLVHIVDCYLHEGIKVFYRVVLSIIIHFYRHSGKRSGQRLEGNAVVTSLRQFCRDMPIRIDKLLKAGFTVRGFSRKEIRRLQIKHEMYITSNKNISARVEAPLGNLPMSRSFSGPMVLQNISTNMVTTDMLYSVWTWLPNRYSVCQPDLLYTTEEHGTSLVTLYQRVENHQPTIIIIKTTNDEIFGAFCSTDWSDRKQKSQLLSYFGTGETFIFTLYPEKRKYDWVGLKEENIPNTANMFQAGDRSILTIGGGHGEAIFLDENLLHCRSEKCDTFNNEPLSQSEDFKCKVVEVYGLS